MIVQSILNSQISQCFYYKYSSTSLYEIKNCIIILTCKFIFETISKVSSLYLIADSKPIKKLIMYISLLDIQDNSSYTLMYTLFSIALFLYFN